MYCVRCGSELDVRHKFCTICGNPVEEARQQVELGKYPEAGVVNPVPQDSSQAAPDTSDPTQPTCLIVEGAEPTNQNDVFQTNTSGLDVMGAAGTPAEETRSLFVSRNKGAQGFLDVSPDTASARKEQVDLPKKKKSAALLISVVVAAALLIAIGVVAFLTLRSSEDLEVYYASDVKVLVSQETAVVAYNESGLPMESYEVTVSPVDVKEDLSWGAATIAVSGKGGFTIGSFGDMPFGTYSMVIADTGGSGDEYQCPQIELTNDEDAAIKMLLKPGPENPKYTAKRKDDGSSAALDQNGGSSTMASGKVEMTLAVAGSTLATDGSVNKRSYAAMNVLDGDPSTCWCEGVEGTDSGEYISLYGDGEQTISGFVINAGYQESDYLYSINSRPKEIAVYADDEYIGGFYLDDAGRAELAVDFPQPVQLQSMTIHVLSTYPGSKYEDCCISEIRVF